MKQETGLVNSASGYVAEVFEGLGQTFTDVEILRMSEVNIVAKGKRCGMFLYPPFGHYLSLLRMSPFSPACGQPLGVIICRR